MKFKAEIIKKIKNNLALSQVDDVKFKDLFIIAIIDLLNNNLSPKISPFDKLIFKENVNLESINNFIQKIKNSAIDEEELLLGLDSEVSDEDLAYNTLNKINEQIKKLLLKQKFTKFSPKDDVSKIKIIDIPDVNENDIFTIPGLKTKKAENTNVVPEQTQLQEDTVIPNIPDEQQQQEDQSKNNLNIDESSNISQIPTDVDLSDLQLPDFNNEQTQENPDDITQQNDDINLSEDAINNQEVEELSKVNINYGDKTGLLEDFVDEISFTETEIELDEEVKEEIKPIEEDEEFKSIIQVANEEAYNAVMEQKNNEVKKDSIFKKFKLWLIKRRINKKFTVSVKPPKEKKSKKLKDLPKELSEKIIVEPTKEQNNQQSEEKKSFFSKGKNLFGKTSSKISEGFSIFRMLTFQDWKAGIIFYFVVSLIFGSAGVAYWYFYIYKKDFNKGENDIVKLEPIKLVIIEKDDSVPADEYVIEEINQVSEETKEQKELPAPKKETTQTESKPNTKANPNKQVTIKQMSAWSSYEKAYAEVEKYKRQGYEAFMEKAIVNGMDIYRVKIKIK